MISKNRIKSIRQLAQKKQRDAQRLFVAEGPKVVGEILKRYQCTYIAATDKWMRKEGNNYIDRGFPIETITEEELQKISFLQSPQEVLAVCEQPKQNDISIEIPLQQLCIALDDVQDPGNLGTIVRIADWFGIEQVICSPNCADVFSPKVVQATMGALSRVNVCYKSLPDYFSQLPSDTPIMGTFLDADNIYTTDLPPYGILLMGNEGHGISKPLSLHVTHRLFIPNYPLGRPTSESLNVAVATAIICAELRRPFPKIFI